MENAIDALKIAGAVLIFVLAISIIILSFGQVRRTADIILDYKDRETSYLYYDNVSQPERFVSLENIIPTIFRAYLENYKIVFEGLDYPLYTIVQNDGIKIDKYTIDLDDGIALAGNKKKTEFLCGILYNDFSNISVPENLTITQESYFKKINFGVEIELPSKSLYQQLNNKKITEYLGIYYLNNVPNIPDAMKEEKRVITYKVENK